MFGTLFGFRGRLSRAGFVECLLSIVLIDAAVVLGQKYVEENGLPGGYGPGGPPASTLVQAIPWALAVFTVWALLAAAVKRCHDRGRPGVLVLLALVPVIGWLWLLVDLLLLAGNKGRNRYGRSPHGRDGVDIWTAAAMATPAFAGNAALAQAPVGHELQFTDPHGQADKASSDAPPAQDDHGDGLQAHEAQAHEAQVHEAQVHEAQVHEAQGDDGQEGHAYAVRSLAHDEGPASAHEDHAAEPGRESAAPEGPPADAPGHGHDSAPPTDVVAQGTVTEDTAAQEAAAPAVAAPEHHGPGDEPGDPDLAAAAAQGHDDPDGASHGQEAHGEQHEPAHA